MRDADRPSTFIEIEPDFVPTPSLHRLRVAAAASGVLPSDPLAVMVDALATTIDELQQRQDGFDRAANATVDRLDGILRLTRTIAQDEFSRRQVEAEAAQTGLIGRIGDVSSKAADKALARRARAVDRRAAAVIVLCVVGAFGIGGAGGWWSGQKAARDQIVLIETELQVAFANGPDSAGLWLDLMRWNDPRQALLTCRRPEEVLKQNGRRACRVPLWVEKAPSAEP